MDFLSGRNFVIVDTETTGFDPEHHEIIDLHAIEVHPSNLLIVREAGGRIKPHYPERMHTLAQQCNGYTPEKWQDARSFEEVSKEAWPLISGNIWVGCNPMFDVRFLRHAFIKDRIDGLSTYHAVYLYQVDPIDIKDYVEPLKKAGKIPNNKLDTICEYLRIDGFENHTARGDCLRTLEVLRRLR